MDSLIYLPCGSSILHHQLALKYKRFGKISEVKVEASTHVLGEEDEELGVNKWEESY